MSRRKIDKPFLITVVILIFSGFFIFSSASLGILTKEGSNLSSVLFNQVFLGLILGTLGMIIASKVNYMHYRKYAFYIFTLSLILSVLVFTPFFGFEHGGAKRWIMIGGQTFQPAEFLKLGFIIYFAAWLTSIKSKVKTFKYGILPMIILLALTGGILLSQPDTGTFLVIFITAMGMLFTAGAKWRHLFGLVATAGVGFGILTYLRPYVLQRVLTFMDPSADALGAGYQIKQSLIAIGSGQWFGRGFGKSIQKFNFLPEPMGDSIFAVTAEEWGFIGCIFLIALFLFFAYRGLNIASSSTHNFGRLLAIGIVILIVSQSFINMASMLGIFPLTGMPLLFVSQGGTALLFTLLEVGIIFNISKYKSRN
ncbi:putative lipid II flippase FtsW [Patescibacteria group bacterium]|nr:putative lipid II flippase FtsW [Patescibacteria group bacterium]